jgi:hypothetical protein
MNLPAFRLPRCAGSALAVACLALLVCSPAQAGPTSRRAVKQRPVAAARTRPPAVTVVATPASPALASGMVISIEPESGRLVMPSPEEMLRLSAAEQTGLLRTSAGLTEIRGPGGAIGVDLQGRFMEFTFVRLDREGRLHFQGVNEAPVMVRQLDPRTPAPAPACEER